MKVHEAINAVMKDVQAVAKTERNSAQGFVFRGIDAVVNTVGPALRKHGVIIAPTAIDANYRDVEVGRNRTRMQEVTITATYTVWGPEGDSFVTQVAAESMDAGDKGTAKAHSVAYRTLLLQLLCIPTDEPDPDSVSYERAPSVPSDAELKAALLEAVDGDKERARAVWDSTGERPATVDEWRTIAAEVPEVVG